MRLYLASSNPGKLRELAALAQAEGIELAPVPGYEQLPPYPEDQPSFALNALEKALHYSLAVSSAESPRQEPPPEYSGQAGGSEVLVLADDSGLVVDALGGRPGVRSARYAGPNATDEDNNRKLIEELRGLPQEKRAARYVCVLALAQRNRVLALISDFCDGHILETPRGAGGFGYDPYFFYPPLNCTLAEVTTAEKNQHSHRAKAFRKLLTYLQQRPFARRA